MAKAAQAFSSLFIKEEYDDGPVLKPSMKRAPKLKRKPVPHTPPQGQQYYKGEELKYTKRHLKVDWNAS